MEHRADWLYEAKWGLASHYLAALYHEDVSKLTSAEWNEQIDAFDVAGLAAQLAEIKVGFYMLTLGQNCGFYLAPNPVYDEIAGYPAPHTSRRNIMLELADALAEYNIPTIAYLPSGAPAMDPHSYTNFEWEWGFGSWPQDWKETSNGKRLVSFQKKWERVIREWSLQFGKKISGWWFDGCYFSEDMYLHEDEPNFHSFAAAARAGNPDSILAFNPGIMIKPLTDEEDFVAGETNEPDQVKCTSRRVEGLNGHPAQFFMWSYLGTSWAKYPIRFSDELAVKYTCDVVNPGGVVMWDLPLLKSGVIPDEFFRQAKTIGQAVAAIRR